MYEGTVRRESTSIKTYKQAAMTPSSINKLKKKNKKNGKIKMKHKNPFTKKSKRITEDYKKYLARFG